MNKVEQLGFTKTDVQTLNNGTLVEDRVLYKATLPTNKDFHVDLLQQQIVIYETNVFLLKAIVNCVVEEHFTPAEEEYEYLDEELLPTDPSTELNLEEEIDLEELAEEIGDIVE